MIIYLDENMIIGARITEAPLNRSATGYGNRIPTRYMIKLDRGRVTYWHRVYAICYSNAASYYVNAGAAGKRFLDSACFERIEKFSAEKAA